MIRINKVLFMMDNAAYKGGAHFATLRVISLLYNNGFEVAVLVGRSVSNEVREQYPFITFITQDERRASQSLLDMINTYDIVCVPFEDSKFRKVAAISSAYKIQWIHIDYYMWKDSSPYARRVSAEDYGIYAKFDKILFVSKANESGFLKIYPELRNKTKVCYMPLNIEKIKSLAASYDIGDESVSNDTNENTCGNSADFNIVTVTRMSNLQKGITRNLEVIERLKNDGYVFKWSFIGDGGDLDALKRYSMALGLDSYVRWTGYKDNPFVCIKNADLFALLSLFEGNPVVIYESLLVGTPVISTYYNTDEAYTPADTGWFVDNNEQAIYEGIKHLLDNAELVRNAKLKLQSYEYDVSECEEQILKIFRDGAKSTALNQG